VSRTRRLLHVSTRYGSNNEAWRSSRLGGLHSRQPASRGKYRAKRMGRGSRCARRRA